MIKVFLIFLIALFFVLLFYRKNISNIDKKRKFILFCLKILIIVAISFLVGNYYFTITKINYKKGKIIFAVDTSESMDISDIGKKRIEYAKNILSDLQKYYSKAFETEIISFSDKAETVKDIEKIIADGKSTAIGNAISEIKDENANIVLLSDGQNNKGKNPTTLNNKNKIYTIGIGGQGLPDIKILDVIYPRSVIKNQSFTIKAVISGEMMQNKKIKISLKEKGREISTKEIVLQNNLQEKEFKITPKKEGLLEYSVEAKSELDEKAKTNNIKKIYIDVLKDKFKVVFLYGELNYEFAFLKREFSKFDKFDFVYLVPKNKQEFYTQYINNKLQPYTKRENLVNTISQSDIFIIGNIHRDYFKQNELQNIKDTILNKNISVIFLGGENSFSSGGYKDTPVSELLPFVLNSQDDFKEDVYNLELNETSSEQEIVNFTEEQQENVKIWKNIGTISSINLIEKIKPGSEVLVWAVKKNEKFPLIINGKFLNVKTTAITTDNLWQIVFKNPSLSKYSNYYRQFLYQLLFYLSIKSKNNLVINFDKDIYQEQDVVNFFVDVNTDEVIDNLNIEVESEKDKISDISYLQDISLKNRFEGNFKVANRGKYNMKVSAKSGDKIFNQTKSFEVLASSLEFEKTKLNKDLLYQIAYKTKGKYYDFNNYQNIKKDIKNEKIRIKEVKKNSLSEIPSFIILILLLLSFEWILRRRWGLL